jgi:L-asparagine transporter-like permease
MLFSLSRGEFAPRFLGRLSRNGTPVAAILVSGSCILIAAAVSGLTPHAYNYLFGVALFDAMIVWVAILVCHLSFRRRYRREDLPVRMPLYPLVQLVGLGLLIAILATMGLDKGDWRYSWVVGAPFLAFLSIAWFIRNSRRARAPATASL